MKDELKEKVAYIIGYHCFPSVIDAKNQRWYYEIADQILSLLAPELEKAEKWEKVEEIARETSSERVVDYVYNEVKP